VIRIDIGPRTRKTAERLGPDITAKANDVLRRVAEGFGDPHRHAGTGLRKLGRRSYEARIDLQWRLVFIHEGARLKAYNIMSHDEVSAWLNSPFKK
jgi:hypothetical protein